MMAPPDIDALIACVEREIRMREHVYPHWVANGRMSTTMSKRETALMQRVLETLKQLREQSPPIQAGLPLGSEP
jgi:hypothetical protein